jgi:cell surface protein SprA
MLPDNEDLNRDNTLNESESYWEYAIDLKKTSLGVGKTNYITDSKQVTVNYADGTQHTEDWYLFRVPIRDPQRKSMGGITDFKSIRFLRMYMTGFEDSITLRFAKLDLVRNQWRQYANEVDSSGNYKTIGTDNSSSINTLAVSIEQNGSRQPVNYVIPPGIERVQLLSNNGVNLLQNEQALSVQLNHLEKGKTPRGVFKTMNIDIRKYGNLSMFLHAESQINSSNPIKDQDITAIIRMGQDFQNNFYEIRIPLKVTPRGTYTSVTAEKVWPAENSMNLSLNDLVNLKLQRDKAHFSYTEKFYKLINSGANAGQRYSVMGNPNLGEIRGILIAFENSSTQTFVDAEVWMNELRLSEMDETGSYAALGRMDMILADLGNVSV